MAQSKSIRAIITERINVVLKDKSLKFTEKQILELTEALKPQRNGGSTNVKVNDEGLVYCNYFKVYMTEDNFKKTPNDKYPPMSIEGTKLRQKTLTLDKQMNKEISEAFINETKIDKKALIAKYDKLKSEV